MSSESDDAAMVLDDDDHRVAALQRLRASRERLHLAIDPGRAHHHAADMDDVGVPRRARAVWRLLMRRGADRAFFSTAASLLQSWWVRQPWYATTRVLGDAAADRAAPWVRRHPVQAIALGVLAGAALAAARPWRWRIVSQRSRLVASSVVRWGVHQLMQAPVKLAIAAAVASWLGKGASTDVEATPAASDPAGNDRSVGAPLRVQEAA